VHPEPSEAYILVIDVHVSSDLPAIAVLPD